MPEAFTALTAQILYRLKRSREPGGSGLHPVPVKSDLAEPKGRGWLAGAHGIKGRVTNVYATRLEVKWRISRRLRESC
jgi:hypothetical protein